MNWQEDAIRAINDGRIGAEVKGNRFCVEFWYCRNEGNIKQIEVGLMDVRAADSILIEYDFERDGYVIKQASVFEWEGSDKECDPKWQEVAFIKAWQLEKEEG